MDTLTKKYEDLAKDYANNLMMIMAQKGQTLDPEKYAGVVINEEEKIIQHIILMI